jgi:tetratricopeptide (TPR) repeat protein
LKKEIFLPIIPMSADLEAAADELCASCGIAALDNVNLKKCACKLVKYCSVDCQRNHRPQHKKACKKRMAEIRDDELFSQPDESYLGECPICCLPNPLEISKSGIFSCCSKRVCIGCEHANTERMGEEGLEQRCPFCREPMPETQEEAEKNLMKRVKANDPVAIFQMGVRHDDEGETDKAFEYFTMAAELGNIEAHYYLSIMYQDGGRVKRDLKKQVYHLEEAAIGGHPDARYNLANHEGRNGRKDRAYKHSIITAKLGDDDALHKVKLGFIGGYVSKDDYASALRGHQTAVDATKSEQRDAAEEYYKRQNQI